MTSHSDRLLNVVIVLYQNSIEDVVEVAQTLMSAAQQTGYTARTTIVVNDQSQPVVSDSRIDIVQGQGNVGFATGVAIGVQKLQSDFTLIVNPDCEIAPDDAVNFLTALAEAKGILVPLLEKRPGAIDFHIYQSWVFTPTRQLSRIVCRRFLTHGSSARLPRLMKAPGTFLGMRTQLALSLDSPFDRSFYLYGEDRELSLRARKLGLPLCIQRDVRVLHPGGGSAEGGRELIERAKADGMLRVAYARYGRPGVAMMIVNLHLEAIFKDLLRGSSLGGARRWTTRRWLRSSLTPPLSSLAADISASPMGSHVNWKS
ncbi:glycosyltransferase [Microbacterium sp. NE2HP2]|uniref:glycosyltransferase family 2 protein n=1 Tax=Microbacterium plantarum TaxID=1816425 RepID=UPI0023651FA9|nr:glycosyltransferase [Microbacterium plantarum]MDD7945815.1 glycosyltransferase [Microbacterium plantarum]